MSSYYDILVKKCHDIVKDLLVIYRKRENIMKCEVNGTELYYETCGQGRPLILVHGNGEDHTIFDRTVRALSSFYTCWLIDSRGHGMSAPAAEYHYADMTADILEFMEQKDIRDAVFCGFSDGGIIGLLAAMKTDRIRELIVCGANLVPEAVSLPLRAFIGAVFLITRDAKMRLMLEEPRIREEDLKDIKAKTLVLAGQNDLIRKEHTLAIAAAIPQSEVRVIPCEGHGTYIVHSDKLAGFIFGFAGR